MSCPRLIPLALLAATLAAGSAAAQGMSYGKAPKLEIDPELPGKAGVEQKIGTKLPMDLTFYDHRGNPVTLAQCAGGKPTLLVLAYYSCPKLCTEVLNGLVGELRKLARDGYVVGRDFNVITVSINPMDSPPFAFKKRHSYLELLDNRSDDEPGWAFLTANKGQGTNVVEAYRTVRTLADAVGFQYAPDNQKQYDEAAAAPEVQRDAKLDKAVHRTKDYVHPSLVTVLTPDGTTSRYLMGLAPADYSARDVKFSLVEAGDGKMGTVTDRLALLCFSYDQHTGKYRPVMRILAAVAAPFPILIGTIVYFALRRSRREAQAARAAAAEPTGN